MKDRTIFLSYAECPYKKQIKLIANHTYKSTNNPIGDTIKRTHKHL